MNDAIAKRGPDEPIRLVLTAPERAGQLRALDALIERVYPGPQTVSAFQSLAASGAPGKRFALEFVARMPDPVPKGVLLLAAQALPDRGQPLPLRLAVAGKLLTSLPDTAQAVGPIVRSVTAGLSRSRTLERMIQLQSRIDRCAALDDMVRTAEVRVKLKCPKCGAKSTRPELIVHLWKRHRLIFERGRALDPRSVVEKAVADAATAHPTAPAEAAFRASEHHFPQSEPLQVLQAVAARQRSSGVVPSPLLEAAVAADSSLCPVCLAPIADRIRPLPPPLALSSDRIAGDGYSVRVRETATGQLVEVQLPERDSSVVPGAQRRLGPRGAGVLAALPVFGFGLLAVALIPFRLVPPFGLAVGLAALGWVAYAAVRSLRPSLPGAAVRCVDVAWGEIAAQLVPSDATARFLTRLCLTTLNRGTPADRADILRDLGDAVADRSVGKPEFMPLLAAVHAMQISDAAGLGRDRVNGLAKLFEAVWRGERTAEYAEHLAEIAVNRMRLASGDAARLSLALLDSAFEHGFLPADLLALVDHLPRLQMAMGMPTPLRLQVACAVWRGKSSEPWAGCGPAVTLFELAKKSPSASRKMLASCPEALLKLELPDAARRALGDVFLTPRGLVIGPALIADPDIAIGVERSPRGGWALQLGRESIGLDRKIPTEMPSAFTAWLTYRVKKLLPLAESLTRTNPSKLRALLKPLVGTCALCGAESIGRTGKIGDRWPLEH